jgi:hypothetical protein
MIDTIHFSQMDPDFKQAWEPTEKLIFTIKSHGKVPAII